MKSKVVFAVLIVILMAVPASAMLGVNYASLFEHKAPPKAGGISGIKITQGIDAERNTAAGKKTSGSFAPPMSPAIGNIPGFTNLTGDYQSSFRGTNGVVSMASISGSLGYIGVNSIGMSQNVTILDAGTTSILSLPGYSFQSIYAYSGSNYLVSGFHSSIYNYAIHYFLANSSGLYPFSFKGVNQTNSLFLGTYENYALVDSFSGTNSYLLQFLLNGSLNSNLTNSAAIPDTVAVSSVSYYNGILYLGGSNSSVSGNVETTSYLLGEISGGSYHTLEQSGGALAKTAGSNSFNGNFDNIYNILASAGQVYAIGGTAYFFNNNSSSSFKTINDFYHVYVISNATYMNRSSELPGNAIPDAPIQISTLSNVSFFAMQSYSTGSGGRSYYRNFEFLLNDSSGVLSNVTSNFSQNLSIFAIAGLNGQFYIGNNAPPYPNILQFSPKSLALTTAPFSPSTPQDTDSPTFWASQSVAGDNGVLTVGGNGFDFYNSTGFHSGGQVSRSGFLLGAAWNGNEFLLIGQKYFSSSFPTQGVIAYLYYPGNNTLRDITGLFPSSLGVNASLITVGSVAGNFLIEGISNTTTSANPILFLYNTTTGSLINESSVFPSYVAGVTAGQIVSAHGYAYGSIVWGSNKVFLFRYHNGSLSSVGPDVTNEAVLPSAYAAYQSESMYTNGSTLYVFESVGNTLSYQQYYYGNDTFTGLKAFRSYYGTLNYVTGYNGNVLILGNLTVSAANVIQAYGLNLSDGIISSMPQIAPIMSYENSFSTVEFNNSVFLVSGQPGAMQYGLWSLNFSALNTGVYNVTFSVPGLNSEVNTPYTLIAIVGGFQGGYEGQSNSSAVSLELSGGSYTYSVYVMTNYEEFLIYGGNLNVNSSQDILITQPVYHLTFKPLNYNSLVNSWSVYLYGNTGGHEQVNNSGPITLYLIGGYNSYSIKFAEYSVNHTLTNQYINVQSNLTIDFSFPHLYKVSFRANPVNNESWFLNLNYASNSFGFSNVTKTGQITEYLTNGSYVAHYGLNNESQFTSIMRFNVSGSNLSFILTLPYLYNVNMTAENLPSASTGFVGWSIESLNRSFAYSSPMFSPLNITSLLLENGTYSLGLILNFANGNYANNMGQYSVVTARVNITVNGSNQSLHMHSGSVYNASLNLSGLPDFEQWYFAVIQDGNVIGSRQGNISVAHYLYLPNGTYNATIPDYSAYPGEVYPYQLELTPFSFNVSGAPIHAGYQMYNVSVIIGNPASIGYGDLTIESGKQSFDISISSGYNLNFFVENGSYNYSLSLHLKEQNESLSLHYTGRFAVSGSTQSVKIATPSAYYTVTFRENGLPQGAFWNVHGNTVSGENVTFYTYSVNAGTNTVVVLPDGKYNISGSSYGTGSVKYFINSSQIAVSGHNLNVTLNYTDHITLYFKETGLPAGSNWGVTIDGVTYTSSGEELSLSVNETRNYNFTIQDPSGYASYPNGGYIDMADFLYDYGQQNTGNATIFIVFNSLSLEKYGYIGQTLDMANGTLLKGDFLEVQQQYDNAPLFLAFDPSNGMVYISSMTFNLANHTFEGYLNILNGTTFAMKARISLGDSWPVQVLYDPHNRNIYIADENIQNNSASLIELNTSSGRISHLNLTRPVPGIPDIAFDPASNQIYFTTDTGLAVINPDTLHVIKYINITAPSNIYLIEEVPQVVIGPGDTIYVTGYGPNITEINAQTNEIAGNISLPGLSGLVNSIGEQQGLTGAMLYDSQNNEIYISVLNMSNGVLNAEILAISSSGNILSSISMPDTAQYSMALNPNSHELWVSNFFTTSNNATSFQGGVLEIDTTNNTIIQRFSTSFGTVAAVYDSATNSILLTNYYSSTVSIIGTSFTGSKAYKVTFNAQNLPPGTKWFVNLSNGLSYTSDTSSISFYEPNGTYGYSIASGSTSFTPILASSNFTVKGADVSISAQFSETTYAVWFNETGLPQGTVWYVNISGQPSSGPISGSSYEVLLPNGSYAYSISSSNRIFSAPSGPLNVNGQQSSVKVLFSELKYTVLVTESGLPTGTEWFLNITGGISYNASSQTISFSLVNGTYTATFATIDHQFLGNTITITVDGSQVLVNAAFKPKTYNVAVDEGGLPAGTTWYFNITGGTGSNSISNASYTLALLNGTYNYTYSTPFKNYQPTVRKGSFTVSGADITIKVGFVLVTYKVTFTENGLYSGFWYVNVSGQKSSGPISGNSYVMSLPNGTYNYVIASSNKIYGPVYPGILTVNGASIAQAITFRNVTYSVQVTENGLPQGFYWYFNITGMKSIFTPASSFSLSLVNGTYGYIAQSAGYSTVRGNITVSGSRLYLGIFFTTSAAGHIKFDLNPAFATLTLNGYEVPTSNGILSLSVSPGTYSINVSFAGYEPFSTVITVKPGQTAYENITLAQITNYGYLTGIVLPSRATVVASGISIPVINGTFNQTLAPGIYYVDISAPGYASVIKTIRIYSHIPTILDVSLIAVKESYTLSGYINAPNGSVTLNGYIAYVASGGFYSISLPAGSYNLSAYAPGYYAYLSILNLTANISKNISLVKAPVPTSTKSQSNVSSSGYNVTVTSLSVNNTQISVNYSSTSIGELVVQLPYSEVHNETVNQLTNSKVYVNGILVKNYTITISANYTVILTVYNLTGDPTLEWAFSSTATVTKFYNVEFTESGLPPGTEWYVNLTNGLNFSSNSSVLSFQLPNGTYGFQISSSNSDYGKIADTTAGTEGNGNLEGVFTVSGSGVSNSIAFTKTAFNLTVIESGLPSGTAWKISINGIIFNSGSGQIQEIVSNGEYAIIVFDTVAYYSNISSMTVSVNNSSVTVHITYDHFAYLNGTASPSRTTVTVNGKVISLSSGIFNLTLPAGTYHIVATLNGYSTFYKNITLSPGSSDTINITLHRLATPSVNKKPSPYPGYTIYIIIGVVAAAAVIGLAVIIQRRR